MSVESEKSKHDILASIRKIMRGGSADLCDVPVPGSKAVDGATDDSAGWSLALGTLSVTERDDDGAAATEPPMAAGAPPSKCRSLRERPDHNEPPYAGFFLCRQALAVGER